MWTTQAIYEGDILDFRTTAGLALLEAGSSHAQFSSLLQLPYSQARPSAALCGRRFA